MKIVKDISLPCNVLNTLVLSLQACMTTRPALNAGLLYIHSWYPAYRFVGLKASLEYLLDFCTYTVGTRPIGLYEDKASFEYLLDFCTYTVGTRPIGLYEVKASQEYLLGFCTYTVGTQPIGLYEDNASLEYLLGFCTYTVGTQPIGLCDLKPALNTCWASVLTQLVPSL